MPNSSSEQRRRSSDCVRKSHRATASHARFTPWRPLGNSPRKPRTRPRRGEFFVLSTFAGKLDDAKRRSRPVLGFPREARGRRHARLFARPAEKQPHFRPFTAPGTRFKNFDVRI